MSSHHDGKVHWGGADDSMPFGYNSPYTQEPDAEKFACPVLKWRWGQRWPHLPSLGGLILIVLYLDNDKPNLSFVENRSF